MLKSLEYRNKDNLDVGIDRVMELMGELLKMSMQGVSENSYIRESRNYDSKTQSHGYSEVSSLSLSQIDRPEDAKINITNVYT